MSPDVIETFAKSGTVVEEERRRRKMRDEVEVVFMFTYFVFIKFIYLMTLIPH